MTDVNFYFYIWMSKCSVIIYWTLSFLYWISFLPLSPRPKKKVVIFLGSPFCSINLCIYYFLNKIVCWLLLLYIKSCNKVVWILQPFFFSSVFFLATLNPYLFHIHYRFSLINIYKMAYKMDFDWYCIGARLG